MSDPLADGGIALFRSGAFQLHSGERTDWKIDCDALTDVDWQTLARIAAARLPAFGSVEGVPRGGVKFAEALKDYATTGPVLIADDVLTTGASLEAVRQGRDALGVVVFARSHAPSWVRALFTFDGGIAPPEDARIAELQLTIDVMAQVLNQVVSFSEARQELFCRCCRYRDPIGTKLHATGCSIRDWCDHKPIKTVTSDSIHLRLAAH